MTAAAASVGARSMIQAHKVRVQKSPPSAEFIAAKPRPRGENVVDLMDALKKSVASEAAAPKGKKPRKASVGQKEMLLPIEGKRGADKKKVAKPERSTKRKAG